MSDAPQTQPPGWYYAQGDPPGTQRYWDGAKWEGGPQPVPGVSQAPATAAGDLAEPVMRIAARLIDYVLWIVVGFIVNIIFIGGSLFTQSNASFFRSVLAGLVITAIVAAYEIVMVANRGQTVGKMALNLRVVRADRSPVDMRDAVMRIVPYIAIGVIGALPIISILATLAAIVVVIVSLVFLFTDPNRQTIWDRVAKTVVVTAG